MSGVARQMIQVCAFRSAPSTHEQAWVQGARSDAGAGRKVEQRRGRNGGPADEGRHRVVRVGRVARTSHVGFVTATGRRSGCCTGQRKKRALHTAIRDNRGSQL